MVHINQKYLIHFIEPYRINWTDIHGSVLYLDYLAGDLVMANVEDGAESNTSDLSIAGGIDIFGVPNHVFMIILKLDR